MVIRVMSKPAVLKQPPYAKLDFSLQSVVKKEDVLTFVFSLFSCVSLHLCQFDENLTYICIATFFYETSTTNSDIIYPVK